MSLYYTRLSRQKERDQAKCVYTLSITVSEVFAPTWLALINGHGIE